MNITNDSAGIVPQEKQNGRRKIVRKIFTTNMRQIGVLRKTRAKRLNKTQAKELISKLISTI